MKTCRIHILLIFLLTVIAHVCNAQTDEIVTLKDEVILCHITREDSTRVFFKIGGNAGSVEASLLRTEIKAIRYAPPQDIPSPSINPSQIVKDKETAPVTSQNNTLHVTLPAHAKQNSAQFLVGYAIPVGKFAETASDSGDIRPGLIGQNLQLGFQHTTKQNIIIGLQLFATQNQLNTDPLRSYYKSLIDSAWMAERAVWRAFGIHVTAGYKKEFNDFFVSARIQAGFSTLVHPQYKLYTNSSNYREYQKSNTDALSFGGGLSLGYRLLQDLYVIADASVVSGLFTFKEILIQGEEPTAGFPNRISRTKRDVKQNYQNLMLNIGLSYRF